MDIPDSEPGLLLILMVNVDWARKQYLAENKGFFKNRADSRYRAFCLEGAGGAFQARIKASILTFSLHVS
jgi:hypothetical protein